MRRCSLATGVMLLGAVLGAGLGTTSLAADNPDKPISALPADWDKIQADPVALARYRCPKPAEFVLLFSLGHASDLMPRDDVRFDRLLAEVKAAGFNTIHCTHTDQRLELCRKHGVKMMIDFLAEDRREHVYKNAADCQALCGKLRGNPQVWGYNIWNGSFSGSGAGRQRDILNVRRWDPTHPVFIGTLPRQRRRVPDQRRRLRLLRSALAAGRANAPRPVSDEIPRSGQKVELVLL